MMIDNLAKDVTSRITLTDITIEILGMMVPGILAVFTAFLTIVFPVILLAQDFSGINAIGETGLKDSITFFQSSMLAVCFLVLSFVTGTLFFRQDPKLVDQYSACRLKSLDLSDGAVTEHCVKNNLVEFPYRYLKRYLSKRGLNYLAQHIPWDENSTDPRTKHFANALKIRIQVTSPAAFRLLARNEAHVRLSSSLWYACGAIVNMAIIGLILSLSCTYIAVWGQFDSITKYLSITTICAGFMFVGQYYRDAIISSFHYQRVREISQILETAHWLQTEGGITEMFDGLSPIKREQSTMQLSDENPL